ncbi:hypothetical protein SD72_01310 [Leucobacter komagatae]|uniref:Uncharacterized protein n=1 Tax=Leucobacter komagatae TaxID=55969 RepID=A0A0D0I277_9MICO|nr:hypothetical protein SD72_01310 [Leucobacter komagatae]
MCPLIQAAGVNDTAVIWANASRWGVGAVRDATVARLAALRALLLAAVDRGFGPARTAGKD